MRCSDILIVIFALEQLAIGAALAQTAADYPTKPVRIVVATAPGGAVDLVPRLVAARLSETLKRQFIVENRAGGGGTIGYGFVAKSAPDGYTLLAVPPAFVFVSALYPDFPYDALNDFAPISLVSKGPFLILAHPQLPAKSLKELIALAKAKPGAVDMGVASGGSLSHLAAVYFASATRIKLTMVPYKGTGELMNDAISGQIHLFFGALVVTIPQVKAGRLRALAVTSAARSLVLPDLPTVSEAGAPGYDVNVWNGWVAPAGTPAAIISKLSMEIAKAVNSPEIAKRLLEDGGEPIGSTPDQFRQLISVEAPRWRKFIKDANMRTE